MDGKEEDELATAAEEAEEDFDAEVDAVAEELALGPPVVFELPADMCDDTVVTVTDDCVEVADIDGSETGAPCDRDVDGPGTGHDEEGGGGGGGGCRIPTGTIIAAPGGAWC